LSPRQKAKPVASCDKPHSLSLSLHRKTSKAKPPELHVSSENAQESFISHFLSRGHIKHRFRKENASERQENALKRKTNRGQSQGIEGQSRAIEHRGLSRAIEGYPGAIPGQSRAIEGNSHTGDADEATDAPRQAYASASNASPCIHEAVKLQSRAIAGAKPGCNA